MDVRAKIASMSMPRRWLYALKPASWPKLLVPMLLGQALGVASSGALSVRGLLWGAAFTLCDLAFIVLVNDFADREVDAIKRKMFPEGCSPKTIPDEILPAHYVLFAGLFAGACATGFASAAALDLWRPSVLLLGLLSVGLFVAYTLPPLRLNYRGGGELLEMAGVGLVLPLLNASLQGPLRLSVLAPALFGFALLALASAVASGLADEISDKRGGKKTFATSLGNRLARRLSEASLLLGSLAWAAAAFVAPFPSWILGAGAAVAFVFALRTVDRSAAATSRAFDAMRHYKSSLHGSIWLGGATVAALLLVWSLLLGGHP